MMQGPGMPAMVIAIPFAGGLLAAFPFPRGDRLMGYVAVAASVLTLLAALACVAGGDAAAAWGPVSVRLDGLSGLVLLACAFFGVVISVYSQAYMKDRPRARTYYVLLLWTLAAACAAVLADDLIVLLACWGFLACTLYGMAGLSGPDAAATAKKTFILVGGADCLFMLGVAIVWFVSGSTSLHPPAPLPLTSGAATAACLCFIAAALAKAGAIPFHDWVPDFGEHALPPASAFLPASLDKLLGIYLLARTVTTVFSTGPGIRLLLMAIGAATVLFAVLRALVQHDLKRLLGWHAVSQVGYMVLGIGTGTAVGIAGGLFHMVNHTLYKACLFLSAGAIEHRAGTTDLDRLGGLARLMPITFAATLVAALSISGLPPLNGFASKWMVYQGVVETAGDGASSWFLWLTAAMAGSALTLASFAKVLHAGFLGKPSSTVNARDIREVPPMMHVPMAVLAGLCILFGVAAHALPLRLLVRPAVPELGEFPGLWWAGPASGLLLAALAAGAMAYWLTMRRAGLRRCETYVGGEQLDATSVQGAAAGEARDLAVSGVDFFNTVRDLPVLRAGYRAADSGALDLYETCRRVLFYGIVWLRAAHTGILPTYVLWLLVGVLVILWNLFAPGS